MTIENIFKSTMNKAIFICFLQFIALNAICQDVIHLKNGSKIESKIVEITSTSIRYNKFTQLEGPIRNVEKHDVSEILYANGEIEKFDFTNANQEIFPIKSAENKNITLNEPRVKNRFYIDGLFGVAQYNYYTSSSTIPVSSEQPITYTSIMNRSKALTVAIRVGNSWSFRKQRRWQPGFQATWLRFSMYLDEGKFEKLLTGPKTFSLVNIGMCNDFHFNEKIGIEANFLFGPSFNIGNAFTSGYSVSAETKFRFKTFYIGLDYQYSYMVNESDVYVNYNFLSLPRGAIVNALTLSVGRKF